MHIKYKSQQLQGLGCRHPALPLERFWQNSNLVIRCPVCLRRRCVEGLFLQALKKPICAVRGSKRWIWSQETRASWVGLSRSRGWGKVEGARCWLGDPWKGRGGRQHWAGEEAGPWGRTHKALAKAKALDSVVPTCVPGQVGTFGSFYPHRIQDQDASCLCSVAGSQGLCSGPESPTMLPAAGQQAG